MTSTRFNAKRLLTGLYYVVMAFLLGITVGALAASTIFASESDMGWDQLANFLGGVMVGGVGGLVVSALTLTKLDDRRRMIYGSAFFVVSVLIIGAARIMNGAS